MLELLDLDKQISKEEYRRVFPALAARLGRVQRRIQNEGVPVILLFEGWTAAGKGSVINRLSQVLDPRGFDVQPIRSPDEIEMRYPWMWRFWNQLPANGDIAIFDRSWYRRVLVDRIEGDATDAEWQQAFGEILEFEHQLTDAGVVLVKFFLHISKEEQRRRLKDMKAHPATAFKVGKSELTRNDEYEKWAEATEEMLERTLSAHSPWTVVESTKGRYRRVKVFETIVHALEEELRRRAENPKKPGKPMEEPVPSPTREQTILDRVDLSQSMSREEYDAQLDDLQEQIFHLEHKLYKARIPTVMAYEGWDAGGKGGNIRRITRGLDPRGYQVVPIAAPTKEELSHHYLWRFWKQLPKAGHITIFDRSWYGRLLVERVEGFCTEDEWQRAYREINEFERQLSNFGTVMLKFWLHIDQDEQLRRFKDRQNTADKHWKITDEDWRNREKWNRYEVAVNEMLGRTSTTYAPWTILEANCKLHARIKALKTVIAAQERALKAKEG